MPQYSYRALNESGRTVRGKISAANENDLFQQLSAAGLTLLDGKPIRDSGLNIAVAKAITARDKIQMFVHLEQLDSAGVPLIDALSDLRDSADSPKLRDLVSDILKDVQEGKPLSEAFHKHPKVFGHVYPALINAGEESGNLTEAFEHLVHHTKWEDEITQRIKKAARYPLFSVVLITGMLGFMMGFVVPGIVEFLRAQGQELPAMTRSLIFTSDFVVNYWLQMILAPIIFFTVLKIATSSSDAIAYQASCLSLRLPVVGEVISKLALSRFAHFFAVMFQSGVPILQCLETAQGVIGNRCLEESMRTVRQAVQNGEPLSESLKNTGQFPSLVIRMVRIGEDSGNLGGVMDNVTTFYDKDVDESIDAMIGMIEPTLTMVSGLIMAWIVVGVMGPIYDTIADLPI